MDENHKIIEGVLAIIYSDVGISQPVYIADIKSEADAEKLSHALPVAYLWNEDPFKGSFTLSMNTPIIGEALETIIPRTDVRFGNILNEVAGILHSTIVDSVISTCEKVGVLPSVAFSPSNYLDAVKYLNEQSLESKNNVKNDPGWLRRLAKERKL